MGNLNMIAMESYTNYRNGIIWLHALRMLDYKLVVIQFCGL
jgi:hypothetical protein